MYLSDPGKTDARIIVMNNIIQQFVIAGAGGFGREVYRFLIDYANCSIGQRGQDWEIRGFIDDNESALEPFDCFPSVVDTIKRYTPQGDEAVVMAVGIPSIRKIVADTLKQRGAKFHALIHPKADVFETASIEEGSIVGPHALVSDHVKVGKFTVVQAYATVGHDVELGDYSELCPKVSVSGFCKIADEVLIGSNAVITPGISVGHHAQISACSYVMRNVRPYSFVQGVPGKEVRDFFRNVD
jgi:sugar O-acyltransferase (sialic acid O-acetyltransferase NeuD family)